jgi:hypothetical protein
MIQCAQTFRRDLMTGSGCDRAFGHLSRAYRVWKSSDKYSAGTFQPINGQRARKRSRFSQPVVSLNLGQARLI